jgi:outer membrane protein
MHRFVLVALCLLIPAGAGAQSGAPSAGSGAPVAGETPRGVGAPSIGRRLGWQADLGAAVIVNPEFQGGDAYRVLPVPYFDVRYVDREGTLLFANVPQGVGGYFLRRRDERGRGFSLGAALAPGFSNRDPEDFPGLDTFGTGLEARVLMDYGGTNWGAQARLARGVAGGHGGTYLDVGASWRRRIPGRGLFALGPNLRVGDGQYMNALYGVTAAESQATGLAAFEAGAGLEAVSVQGLVGIGLSRRWRFTTIARVGLLTGDAADSSLAQTRTQVFFLSAVTRSF